MNCPKCGYPAKATDTFCEKCGIVFEEYNLIISKQNQQQQQVQQQQQKQKTNVYQHQLENKYLCNSENYQVNTSQANPVLQETKQQFSSQQISVGQTPVDKQPAKSQSSNSACTWCVRLLLVTTIIAVIFFIYFFVII